MTNNHISSYLMISMTWEACKYEGLIEHLCNIDGFSPTVCKRITGTLEDNKLALERKEFSEFFSYGIIRRYTDNL